MPCTVHCTDTCLGRGAREISSELMRDKAGEPSERRSTSSSITLALERQCETPPRLSRLLAPSLQSSQSQLSFRMMLFDWPYFVEKFTFRNCGLSKMGTTRQYRWYRGRSKTRGCNQACCAPPAQRDALGLRRRSETTDANVCRDAARSWMRDLRMRRRRRVGRRA